MKFTASNESLAFTFLSDFLFISLRNYATSISYIRKTMKIIYIELINQSIKTRNNCSLLSRYYFRDFHRSRFFSDICLSYLHKTQNKVIHFRAIQLRKKGRRDDLCFNYLFALLTQLKFYDWGSIRLYSKYCILKGHRSSVQLRLSLKVKPP